MTQDRAVAVPTIDVHTHMIPAALYEAARDERRWHGVDFALTPEGKLARRTEQGWRVHPWESPGQRPEERLAVMDAMRVDAHVLSLTPTMYWYQWPADRARDMAREVNTAIAEIVAAAPDRFQGLAHLPLQDSALAVAELEHAVRGLGLAGAAVGTHVAGANWDEPELFAVLEAAAGLDVMVFVHPAGGRFPAQTAPYHLRNVVGNPLETTMAFASMAYGAVFDRLPGLRVCLAHGGGYVCGGLGRMDHASRAREECADMAALPSEYAKAVYFDSLTHGHQALRAVIDQVGIEQVVLGTDYPADMAQADPVDWLRAAPITDGERAAILGRNARTLLGSSADALRAAAA